MQTEAQKRFDKTYLQVRRQLLQGRITCKDAKQWIRLTGLNVNIEIDKELTSEKMIRSMKNPSMDEQLLMKEIHEDEGYNGDSED